ncbi:zinc finger CCCH domain-containing protein 13-like [Daphnia pulex]|uniref:zinc finger CCCH domain-containing protein 13-like n=1 Tax=Daphnia pulex TaxID=6669 RepID=UPI001EDFE933|nr:zinc finger CCCH domain-containing protein 13-like [Daphnia pulex]
MSIGPNEARGGNGMRRRAPSAIPSLDPRANNFLGDLIDVEQVGEVEVEDEVTVPSVLSAERRAYAEIERMRQQRDIERQQRERERQEETVRRQRQERHQQRDRDDRLRREQEEADRRERRSRSREERRNRDARPRSKSRSPHRSNSTKLVQTPLVPVPPVTRNALPPSPPPPTAGPSERLQHPRKVLVSKKDSRNFADWLNKSVMPAELKGFADNYPIEFEKKEFSLAPPRLDDWMTRRLKESAAHKASEVADKTWISVQLKVLDLQDRWSISTS